jgi:NLR family CARD domain-containing protein 3
MNLDFLRVYQTVTNSLFQRTVLWKVVQNFLPGKAKDQNSGESERSGIMWSFAAGSNLAKSTASTEKVSRKNLNKFYKELRTLKTVNMAGNSRN